MHSSSKPIPTFRPLPWLDIIRAGAAMLVLVSHVRALTLRDASAQGALSVAGRALFAVSGLGHQAVIVFFVLSGFLVTRSMQRLAAAGQWSLARFGVERLTRLWLVLVPCLCLGGVLDAGGLAISARTGAAGYYGDLTVSGPGAAPVLDAPTLVGNLLFLQTVAVPVFGSNGPLWSLADEAWFYALAALAFAAWRERHRSMRATLPVAVMAAAVAALPWSVLALFPVWLCGAACAIACDGREPSLAARWRSGWPAFTCFLAVLLASRLRIGPAALAMDWLLGLATAWLIACATRWPDPAGWWWHPVHWLSAVSYSLYLSHVPLLAFCTTLLVGPHRLALNEASLALMLLEIGLALGCAAGLWWGFERHTPALRRWILGWADGGPASAAALAGKGAGP